MPAPFRAANRADLEAQMKNELTGANGFPLGWVQSKLSSYSVVLKRAEDHPASPWAAFFERQAQALCRDTTPPSGVDQFLRKDGAAPGVLA